MGKILSHDMKTSAAFQDHNLYTLSVQTRSLDSHNPSTCPPLPVRLDVNTHILSQTDVHIPAKTSQNNGKAPDIIPSIPDDAGDISRP
jgi:hypothetical protein